MPSAPIFGDIFGKEGVFEIFRQINAERLGHAQCNIHGTGKIGVQLESKAYCGKPDISSRVLCVIIIYGIDYQIHPFRYDQDFEKSPYHALHSESNLAIIERVGDEKLFPIFPVTKDRAGKDGREIHSV